MLTYFRVNDPYRVIGVFILLILIRLPYLLYGAPITIPELNWMLVGETMAEGNTLYSGVRDNIGPLAALIYSFIELLFNRSTVVYVILAIFLTTIQSLIFNNFLLNKKAYNENTYVPALVYVLLSSFSFDFYFLSPVLISLTWILLALRNVVYRVESRSRDNRILSTGIYIGLAALCYLPGIIFLLSTIIAYLLFANISFRRYLLLLTGTALPFLVSMTYFFLTDAMDAFIEQYILSFQNFSQHVYTSPLTLLYIGMVALIFLLLSMYRVGQMRFTNQQNKLQQIMFINILATLATLFFVHDLAPYHLLPFVPPVAFFVTHYLLSIRKFLLGELATVLLATLTILNGYAFLFGLFSLDRVFERSELLVEETPYDELVSGKDILVIGDRLSIYRNARLATPYLNWQLSAPQLQGINYFSNLTAVYNHFSGDMPEVIIDLEYVMPQLQSQIPLLESSYQLQPGSQNVYLLKSR